MTLRHLKIFISVCENKSTVAAANILHIAQPSISFAIKELENEYGIKLFERISRKMILTEEGKIFLYQAREIMSKINQIESSLKDCDIKREIKLGCSVTIGIFLLPKILKIFKETNKNIKISVIIKDSKTLSQLVIKNEIDIALIETPLIEKDLDSTAFYKDSLMLFLSKENPLSSKTIIQLKDLENQNLIFREEHSAVRTLIDSALVSNNIKINHPWESVSTQAILSLVENNLGVSILPSLWISDLNKKSNIITKKINDISFEREYLIINHKNKYISPLLKKIIDICTKNHFE